MYLFKIMQLNATLTRSLITCKQGQKAGMIPTYPLLSCQSASLLPALLVCVCASPAAFCLSKVFC